jgi:hypothetical protein
MINDRPLDDPDGWLTRRPGACLVQDAHPAPVTSEGASYGFRIKSGIVLVRRRYGGLSDRKSGVVLVGIKCNMDSERKKKDSIPDC